MKRDTPLKRSTARKANKPIRRKHPRVTHHKLWLEAEILSSRISHEAARKQRHCQNPTCTDNPANPDFDPRAPRKPWHAHHVVYAQDVQRLGHSLWSTMNVLRLCEDCHARHHARIAPLPLSILRQDNYRYAFTLMGERAFEYLRRRYNGKDPRLDWWLGAWEHGRV